MHSWLPDSESWSSKVVAFGSSDQPEVSIWNCSQPDAEANYPAGRVDDVQPEKPDLVLYSFGHDDSAGAVSDHLSSTIAAVQKHWTSDVAGVVILQNPGRWAHREAQSETLSALAVWAAVSDQLTIDVATAFRESPRPLAALMRDDTNPNAAGSPLWEETVATALS